MSRGSAFAAAASAPPVIGSTTRHGEHRTIRFEPLAGHRQTELVEPAERGQVRARGEGSVRHVEVFRMGSVGTSILGRPRPLSRPPPRQRRYTLNCEEPTKPHEWAANAFDALYRSETPSPSPARSFTQTCELVGEWYERLMSKTQAFLSGLAAWPIGETIPDTLLELALEHYRDSFLRLAAQVPEFRLWHFLGEHAATQATLSLLPGTLGPNYRQSATTWPTPRSSRTYGRARASAVVWPA